ncbi:MAG: LCP family protein [Alicyclobacillaceae bacterium]|nr:LCP family protein [Alicyclobacillaceae bacterium]
MARRLRLLILAAVLFGAGYYGWGLGRFLAGIVDDGAPPGRWPEGDVRVLLLGVDNRGGDPHPRSDTMILLNVPRDGRPLTVASILRDTWVPVEGAGKEKINAAYALGGPDLARRTVEQWLGVDVPYYAVTDFEGFIHIVDALGGVDIDVEKPMDYVDDGRYDIHLRPGRQHLNGAEALGYVRFRHDALGDYARTERQRKLIKAVAEEMKKPKNLIRLPEVLWAVRPYVRTNVSPLDLVRLGWYGWRAQFAGIEALQLPQPGAFREGWSPDGQSILVPDTAAVQAYVRDHFAAAVSGFSAGRSSGRGTVVAEWVNVRAGPGTDYPVVGRLERGAVFEVTGREAGWASIRLKDGRDGYVSEEYIRLE